MGRRTFLSCEVLAGGESRALPLFAFHPHLDFLFKSTAHSSRSKGASQQKSSNGSALFRQRPLLLLRSPTRLELLPAARSARLGDARAVELLLGRSPSRGCLRANLAPQLQLRIALPARGQPCLTLPQLAALLGPGLGRSHALRFSLKPDETCLVDSLAAELPTSLLPSPSALSISHARNNRYLHYVQISLGLPLFRATPRPPPTSPAQRGPVGDPSSAQSSATSTEEGETTSARRWVRWRGRGWARWRGRGSAGRRGRGRRGRRWAGWR